MNEGKKALVAAAMAGADVSSLIKTKKPVETAEQILVRAKSANKQTSKKFLHA